MDDWQRIRQGRSFGAVAEAYDRARPSYPDGAVRFMVGGAPRRVLDLGAGTGALTRLLLAAGHVVVAVDPLLPMLRHLRQRSSSPRLQSLAGTAEQIPLRRAVVDSITIGQAFHWFDDERAVPELARVLRSGGVLSMVWNLRDESVPWVRRLGAIIGSDSALPDPSGRLGLDRQFGPVQWQRFRLYQSVNRGQLLDLVRSRSHIAVLDDADRRDVLARVGELYDEQRGDVLGLQLPYVTHCLRAVRIED
ncbi:MAG: methyltransferase domain-containing protein [Nocardioidaceae bacterium]|nr:methyltransferase domain-containing protein [Nocardioidaceae bacterium]